MTPIKSEESRVRIEWENGAAESGAQWRISAIFERWSSDSVIRYYHPLPCTTILPRGWYPRERASQRGPRRGWLHHQIKPWLAGHDIRQYSNRNGYKKYVIYSTSGCSASSLKLDPRLPFSRPHARNLRPCFWARYTRSLRVHTATFGFSIILTWCPST